MDAWAVIYILGHFQKEKQPIIDGNLIELCRIVVSNLVLVSTRFVTDTTLHVHEADSINPFARIQFTGSRSTLSIIFSKRIRILKSQAL
jgi:hypothetical protein